MGKRNILQRAFLGAVGLLCLGSLHPVSQAQTYPTHNQNTGFEAAGYVPAQNFLGPELMQSPLYRVNPQAYNDGRVNTYRIDTPGHSFMVQGTAQAKMRIHEINMTEQLRRTSTPEAIGIAAVDKTVGLVETPYRAAKFIGKRAGAVSSVEDAVLFIPAGAAEVVGSLASGIGEVAVTGTRIANGAAGTKCSGIGACVAKAGEDLWSGANSLLGKHDAARGYHASIGTDPETDNRALRRQINRLSYAKAYTGAIHKFGLNGAGIRYLSDYSRGEGYFNNAEFLAGYEDAHRQRNREIEALTNWGVPPQSIDAFYANPAFTKKMRFDLVAALSALPQNPTRMHLAQGAANIGSRYAADSQIKLSQYFASMAKVNDLSGFLPGATHVIAIKPNGTLVFPVTADYLQWTPEMASPIKFLGGVRQAGRYNAAELHVIGSVSQAFRQNSESQGVRIIDVK